MRSLLFLISALILLLSCNNDGEQTDEDSTGNKKDEKQQPTVIDSLPDADWNGEYMKINTEEEESKIKRKSQGSDFYNMGRVDLKIGEDRIDFKLFERKRNALTFTNNSINAIIKSAFNEDLHVYLKKENIITNYKGKYKADPSGKTQNSFSMEILAGEKNQQKKYVLENGEAELLNFSPQLGTFEMKVKGLFSLESGEKVQGQGVINMRFEEAVMTSIE